VGPLPVAVQRITIYWAGVTAGAKSPEAARAFIHFLVSPAGKQAMTKSGLEPIDSR
jgi:molybdate transport system substrate-binding protein